MSRCRRFRPLIVGSIEGDIAPADALRVARHLQGCTSCRIVLARESRLAGMLADLNDPIDVDESFFDAVMASLPERAPLTVGTGARRQRLRRGLKLAGIAGLGVMGAGVAARILPSVRLDLSAPAMPRFAPEDTDGWLSLVGSAAQWIRVTAQSLAWTGSPEAFGPRTLGLLSIEAAFFGAALLLAVSAALMLASRAASRVS